MKYLIKRCKHGECYIISFIYSGTNSISGSGNEESITTPVLFPLRMRGFHWLDLLLHWDSLKIRNIDQWCVQIQTNQLSPHHWFVLPWILSLFRPIGLAESCAFSSVYDKNHELIVIRKHLAILPFISDIYWPVHVRKMW